MKSVTPGLLLLLLASTAQADLSANLGFASDYYFRGIFQKNHPRRAASTTSQAASMPAPGRPTSAATLPETGWKLTVTSATAPDLGEVNLGIGFTGYYYTGDFDDTYQEINLSAGYGWLTVDAAIGKYDDSDGPTLDYQFYSATVEHNGLLGPVRHLPGQLLGRLHTARLRLFARRDRLRLQPPAHRR